jgi:hypothetical protein
MQARPGRPDKSSGVAQIAVTADAAPRAGASRTSRTGSGRTVASSAAPRQRRRLDLRPLLQQQPQDRLQRIKPRARRPPAGGAAARRLPTTARPSAGGSLKPHTRSRAARRCPPSPPAPEPLQRAPHLSRHHRPIEPRRRGGCDQRRRELLHASITDPGAVMGCVRQGTQTLVVNCPVRDNSP